jgi:protein gp37
MAESAIEWTDETWNPVTGCDRVSPGCAHCYALDLAARLKGMGQKRYQNDGDPKTSGPGFAVTLHPDKVFDPVRWTKPRRVFVNSMSDLFHEAIPDEFIVDVFAVMAAAPRHTFQVLTKREDRMAELLGSSEFEKALFARLDRLPGDVPKSVCGRVRSAIYSGIYYRVEYPLPNVLLGVSIENRRFVHRADRLRETPAALRFISAEPLLGPLLRDGGEVYPKGVAPPPDAVLAGETWADDYHGPELDLTGIDWLIVGGESGKRHRRLDPQWVRDLRDACQRDHDDVVGDTRPHEQFPRWSLAGTAFFFKQWGGTTPKAGGRLLDGREWNEFPSRPSPVAVH